MANYSSVPVINALTDSSHPCQALADVMTIRERFGRLDGVRLAYLGDGNNVCASLMVAAAKLGMSFVGAFPAGYEPSEQAQADAREAAAESGRKHRDRSRPRAGGGGRRRALHRRLGKHGRGGRAGRAPGRVPGLLDRRAVLELAGAEAVVMHCLPAHYGEEISEEIVHGPRSAVWDQAENRLHTQKALMALVLR